MAENRLLNASFEVEISYADFTSTVLFNLVQVHFWKSVFERDFVCSILGKKI